MGSIYFSRLVKTFKTSLYITLHRLISLNSLVVVGFLTFGISTIKVKLIPLSNILPLRKFFIVVLTSEPIIDQYMIEVGNKEAIGTREFKGSHFF